MIEGFSYDDLTKGVHSFTASYENKKATFYITIIEDEVKEDVFYEVTFVDMDGAIIDIIKVKENEYLDSPVTAPEVSGYNFVGWSVSFPLLVTNDVIVLASYEKDHKMDDAINYLGEYFEHLGVVNDNIELPINYNGVEMH